MRIGRDLARYSLLFARQGEGVDGRRVGDADFIAETRLDPGPAWAERPWEKYSRQTSTDGVWIGHGGFGGQYMLANPDSGTVVAYLGVMENKDGDSPDLYDPLIRMMAGVAEG